MEEGDIATIKKNMNKLCPLGKMMCFNGRNIMKPDYNKALSCPPSYKLFCLEYSDIFNRQIKTNQPESIREK
jgi:hypothetical protein